MTSKIADPSLVSRGRLAHEWAKARMSILDRIVRSHSAKPLSGLRLGICLHVTRETSVLAMAAKDLGAQVSLCSANPLSAQDDIAAFLDAEGIGVYAWRAETEQEYRDCIRTVAESRPHLVIDDGGDLHSAIHGAKKSSKLPIGGTEETTSGVKRLKALEAEDRLLYPVIAVNNAKTKFLFDNQHGTGQSTIDGVLRSTGMLVAGKTVVVCGYGWVGRGVASRARGMGARVVVTEVDPVKALEAHMDGYDVRRMSEATLMGDLIITCTGQKGVIRAEYFKNMKDGAILANAGHFNVEIDVGYLKANGRRTLLRPNLEQYVVSGRKLYLLSEGRVVNLVAAEGNPPEVMALSFANQLLCILYSADKAQSLEKKVYGVPDEIDRKVAAYALEDRRLQIDSLTPEQEKYSRSS
ncbi:MAG: adenosylhomocysteinase [Nitrososphaera sp.]|jgi:adenosylhomocysteinase